MINQRTILQNAIIQGVVTIGQFVCYHASYSTQAYKTTRTSRRVEPIMASSSTKDKKGAIYA